MKIRKEIKLNSSLRTVINRIWADFRKNWQFIVTVLGWWIAMNLIFHHTCPVVLLCGYPCPGCGITRAFLSFFSLHPIRAFQYNPTYPLWLFVIISAIWVRYFKGQSLKRLYYPLLFTAVITLAVYIYRIVFLFPGTEPMVYVPGNLFELIRSAF